MPAAQLGVTGIINANGTVKEAFENFTSEKTATGTYKITYKPEFIEYASVGVNPIGNASAVSLSEVSKKGFIVKFTLLATLLLGDTAFSFQCIGE
jgi:hypothetical protein